MHHVGNLVEASLDFVLPTHENKEVVNFNHTYGLIKEPLVFVDENIDTFIHIGKHIWSYMGCFIFYGDPIYDIEGTF